jgi:predicted peptidase
MKLSLELVDHLRATQPIDSSRCYVTGLSMGGMGAWYAAAQSPRRFAAMLEVCGGGDPSWADRYTGIPIWAFHGQADRVIPIGRGREMIKALTDVGHAPEMRYVEYPGVGHDSWTKTFARDDVYEWLFAQKSAKQ